MKAIKMTQATGSRLGAWALIGIILVVLFAAGCTKTQQVLVREPASPAPSLEGRWDLVSYGLTASETKVLSDTQVFISFTNDGKISGSGGCNRYFGGWGILEGTKDTIRIWRTGSTKMACQDPVMTQEYGYLEELSRVSSFAIEGRELRLYFNEGRGVLRFTRGVNP
ncbi:MAG TPA: META domain-containing protein [Syntrophales bacterium]|nr:META domain-containing protein [Syntrophales bacterium]